VPDLIRGTIRGFPNRDLDFWVTERVGLGLRRFDPSYTFERPNFIPSPLQEIAKRGKGSIAIIGLQQRLCTLDYA